MTTETSKAGVHTCSYACERPECIRAQRDELVSRMTAETSNARGDLQAVLQEMRDRQVARRFKSQTLADWADRIEAALAAEGVQAGEAVRAQFEWADLPWRAAVGWLRSASGSKIFEVGDHDGCITQRESELIAAAVNAYTAAQQQGQAVAEVGPGWTLAYCGSDPIAEICRRHPELRIGTKLYTAPPSAPVGVIGDAIRHLSKWLDLNDCECESGHQCGRIEVEQTRDQLRAIAQQPAAVDGVVGRYEGVTAGVAYIKFDNDDAPDWDGKSVLLTLATQHQEPTK